MADQDNTPFFILGAPRSGTTLLRNLLKMHHRLECPEETHFFRWPDPYGSKRYRQYYKGSPLFRQHRELDGVCNFDFFYTLDNAPSRRWLADWYGQRALERNGSKGGRWFDKTPQNVYGILLLAESYPEARFVHIYRNPLNVVASLKSGRVMPKQSITAAVNAWLEPMMILRQFRHSSSDRLHELAYEELAEQPRPVLEEVFDFLHEGSEEIAWSSIHTHPEQNRYLQVLDGEEIQLVVNMTDGYRQELGYE